MHITHGLATGQVLQRRRNQTASALVTGTCSGAGPIHVRIARGGQPVKGWANRRVGHAARGKFSAKLDGIPVGGPYTVTFSMENDSLSVSRVYVGDVWLLGGQSNMQGCGVLRGAPSPHPLVHAMYMDRHWDLAKEPIHFPTESPDNVHNQPKQSPAQVRVLRREATLGVGPGIHFGKEMVRRSGGVPQGLICTAHGGTSMEQWDPALKNKGGDSLYGSMMLSLRHSGQPVSGMLWYQGESDATEKAAPLFTKAMKRFVVAIRRDFKQPNLPFIMVQIGRVYGANWAGPHWNGIQNQQYELKKYIRNLECVPTIDLPLDDTIHISAEGNARLGVRLARLADRMVYGNRKELPAPELVSVERVKNKTLKPSCPYKLKLTFRNTVGGLRAHSLPTGFSLVNDKHEDTEFIFKTEISGKNVVFLETMTPAHFGDYKLMHGHGRFPHVNITDSRDMPIPVFGPVDIAPNVALCPFITQWLVSEIQKPGKPIRHLSRPNPSSKLRLKKRSFPSWFLDMHEVWGGRPGQCFFFTDIKLDEKMQLNLRVGSDGPMRVWIDNKLVLQDLAATNPCILDKNISPVTLQQGKHRITVAIDLNGGLAWGFNLRFNRNDISLARARQRDYAVPICCLK